MRLYTMVKKQWEAELKVGKKNKNSQMANAKEPKYEESQKVWWDLKSKTSMQGGRTSDESGYDWNGLFLGISDTTL